MTALAIYLVAVLTTTAGMLAHHQQDAPPTLLWRLWRAHRAFRDSSVAGTPERAADGRTARPAPTWAHTDHHDYEEAA